MCAAASIGVYSQSQLVDGPRLRNVLRKSSLSFGIAFILLLLVLVVVNSSKRNSVLTFSDSTTKAESYFTGLAEPGTHSSQLRLQDFHRVAIKDGRTIWEVRAKDAQYFNVEGITHLNQASLILYQEDNSKIALKADAAKLRMGAEGLSRAELSGNVFVEWDNGMQIRTDSALYKLVSSEISAPGWVKIAGDGYLLEGDGFYALIDQQVTLARNVRSVFTGKSSTKSSSKSTTSGAQSLLDKMRPKGKKQKVGKRLVINRKLNTTYSKAANLKV